MSPAANRPKTAKRQRQRGAAALEFALLFLIFFAVLYAIIGYALMLLVQQGLTQAAAEGARASVRLDQMSFTSTASYEAAVATIARDTAIKTLDWLPSKAKAKAATAGSITTSWVTGSKTVTTGGSPLVIATRTLTVSVTYPGYASDPMIPALTIPGIGQVPGMPTDLIGRASIQLQL